jgi:FMN phosphatase YigB (HAD superfamily)
MTIKLICSDCDGVLANIDHDYSKSGYYVGIRKKNQKTYDNIQRFLGNTDCGWDANRFLLKAWMNGEITYKELNRMIAYKFDCDPDYLDKELLKSAEELEMNWTLIELYQKYRKNGIKVVITTDNMDIFSLGTIPANKLDLYFDKIYNSFDLKILKRDNNFGLYKKIAEENELKLEEVLIVDDTVSLIDRGKELGFSVYLFNSSSCNGFEKWLEDRIYLK